MRSLAVLLTVALLSVAPARDSASAAAITDNTAQLMGTWSCRNGYGVTSQLTFRANADGFVAQRVVVGPSGRKESSVRRYRQTSDGGWNIEATNQFGTAVRETAPPWTGETWPLRSRSGSQWYAFGDAGTLRISAGETGPTSLWELCLRGDTPPDASTCITPELPAVVRHAVEPDTPAMAQQQGIQGTVHVRVSLDADSRVVGTSITSSPSTILNAASMFAARQSSYFTARHECKPVPSEYDFAVQFSSR